MTITILTVEIRKVCPIDGVNSSRVISFKPEATQDQRNAAQAIANSWDFDAVYRDIQGEIDAMEKATLMPRATREFMLVLYAMQAATAGITVAQLLDAQNPAYSPAYARLSALDTEIAALRALL